MGEFAFYLIDTLILHGKVKIRGCHNTNRNYNYDEDENTLFGIYYWGLI